VTLQRADIFTTSAELLLARMEARLADLCREREALRYIGRLAHTRT